MRGFIRFSFFFACLLALSASGAEKKTSLQYWQETGLRATELQSRRYITNSACSSNRTLARACISALDGFATNSDPARRLLPKAMLMEFKGRVGNVERDLGSFVLVPVLETPAVQTPEKSLFEKVSAEKKTRERLFAVIDSLAQSGVDFETIRDEVIRRTLVPERESLQTAAAINAYLSYMDGHARIQPTQEFLDMSADDGNESFVGVGISLNKVGTEIVADSLIDGGPAQAGGVQPGDVIESVNGQRLDEKTVDAVVKLIRGAEGTAVTLEIKRGADRMKIQLARKKIETRNVTAKLLRESREKIGYIRLSSFMNQSGCTEIRNAIRTLENEGARALILDLRGNLGGLVVEAVCMGGLFVGKEIIVKIYDFSTKRFQFQASFQSQATQLPLVVLIDAGSASASELLSGALQDHKRAWLLGERSFGKGTVQAPEGYDASSLSRARIRLFRTIARFHQPSGRSNQIVGIIPSFEVPFKPGATESERFRPREIDYVPNALPAHSEAWQETRPEDVRRLRSCMQANGTATARYQKLAAKKNTGDFQLMSAQDLLDCAL